MGAYEKELGITPKASDTISARVAAVKAEAEHVVAQVLPAPLSEDQRDSLTGKDLELQTENLAAALVKVSQLQLILNDEAPVNTTKLKAVAKIKQVDNHLAVEGQIEINGQKLETLLTDGSFHKTREDQIDYAKKLGYRMATREEQEPLVHGRFKEAVFQVVKRTRFMCYGYVD